MFIGSLDYTICSTNPAHYNRINCNLVSPITKYASFIVTSLTANFDMIILNKDDYMIYEEFVDDEWIRKKIQITDEYKPIDRDYGLTVLRLELVDDFEEKIDDNNYKMENLITDKTGRFVMKRKNLWRIIDMSYNIKLITGFYNIDLPICSIFDEISEMHYIRAESVGLTMSTPILYLISNVGIQSYRTNYTDEIGGAKIVMRINNAYISNTPIVVNNGDFKSTVLSNDLSMLEFVLVDANIHEISLLSPMYLTIHVDAIEDEKLLPGLMFSNEINEEDDE